MKYYNTLASMKLFYLDANKLYILFFVLKNNIIKGGLQLLLFLKKIGTKKEEREPRSQGKKSVEENGSSKLNKIEKRQLVFEFWERI